VELLLTAMGCGLVLGVLWIAGRRTSQAETMALIGETYLRAAGGVERGRAAQAREPMPWDR
jgi:hypothetical protein